MMRSQIIKQMEEIEEYTRSKKNNQILENIDSYNVDIKVEKNTDEYPLKKDFSKFIIHKKEQNKNILYRDKQDNHCYIMYDNNYSSIEYDLENNIITCYGDNDKPCFTHSLNDNVQTWFEYDLNDNILYSYDSEGNSYMNFYTYYGELLVKENFDKRLIKDVQINRNSKIINYVVDESERISPHDGIVLTLKYKDNELISYESDFYKWDKKHNKHEPEEPDIYFGKPCSYIEVLELKKFRESTKKEYNYYNLIRYHTKKYLLKESNKLCTMDIIEYYVYDEQGKKIWGIEGSLDNDGENHKGVTFEYDTNYGETTMTKKYTNQVRCFVQSIYNCDGNLYYMRDNKGTKHYNKYGTIVYDDGYLLSERYESFTAGDFYSGGSPDSKLSLKEYVYNDNKIIIFKKIFDDFNNQGMEIFKYNDNGKLLYYEKDDIYSKNKIQIYEYDEKDRLVHEYLIIGDVIHYESFRKYNDQNNLVKITSYTLK